MNKEDFKKYYQQEDVTSSYSEQRLKNNYRIKKRQKELELFLELLDKTNGEEILEIGCSSGFLTKHLGKATAIDTSATMLQFTKEENPQAKVLEADMFNLPFKNNSFDKIITMRVWNHLDEEDLRKVSKEARRVLREGGILVFDIEEKNWLRRLVNFFYKRIKRIKGFKVYQYSFIDIQVILREEGFKIDDWRLLDHRVGKQIVLKFKKIK